MHKEELVNCQIQVYGSLDYRYNETIAVPLVISQKQANLGPWNLIQQQN